VMGILLRGVWFPSWKACERE